jgi:transcriptional regulator with XRE-family HTH domain
MARRSHQSSQPDVVIRLRDIRHRHGMSQKDVARLSGVGEKTVSSFETGQRIDSLKLAQLRRLLKVYGLTEAQFFSNDFDADKPNGEVEREKQQFTVQEARIAAIGDRMDPYHRRLIIWLCEQLKKRKS